MARFNSGGSSGGGVTPDLILDVEVITQTDANTGFLAFGTGTPFFGTPFQIDVANPLRLFKITDLEIIMHAVAVAATSAILLLARVDASPPVLDGMEYIGTSTAFVPVSGATHKLRCSSVIVRGDDFISAGFVMNGNGTVRTNGIQGNTNALIIQAFANDIPKGSVQAWVANTHKVSARVFHRRVIA